MCDESLYIESTFPVYEETWLLGMHLFSFFETSMGLETMLSSQPEFLKWKFRRKYNCVQGSKYRFCMVFNSMLQTDGEYIYNGKKICDYVKQVLTNFFCKGWQSHCLYGNYNTITLNFVTAVLHSIQMNKVAMFQQHSIYKHRTGDIFALWVIVC